MAHAESRSPQTAEQRANQVKAITSAIGRICDSWEIASDAAESRGQGGGSDDVAVSSSGSVGDPTGNAAMVADHAETWLRQSRAALRLLVAITPEDADVPRWVGSFYPPTMRAALIRCGVEAVALWPRNFGKLIARLVGLANTASNEWPPSPKPGERVGEVVVGKRAQTLEYCGECGQPVAGGAADPIVRIDGKAHHRNPCYYTVYSRTVRARVQQPQTRSTVA